MFFNHTYLKIWNDTKNITTNTENSIVQGYLFHLELFIELQSFINFLGKALIWKTYSLVFLQQKWFYKKSLNQFPLKDRPH